MPNQNNLNKIWEEYNGIFWKKLKAYGEEDINIGGLNGIATRLQDKISRLKNLIVLEGQKINIEGNEESMRDTLLDTFGYALIGLLVYDEVWETQKKGREKIEDVLLIKRSEEAKEFPISHPKKEGDVGYDLYTSEDTMIPALNSTPVNIPTGIQVKLPPKTWGDIRSRSSSAKKGIEVVSCVIDNGYTGPLFACCYNRTKEDIMIKRGERLSQFVIHPICTPQSIEVDDLPETERGGSGFGSTGK